LFQAVGSRSAERYHDAERQHGGRGDDRQNANAREAEQKASGDARDENAGDDRQENAHGDGFFILGGDGAHEILEFGRPRRHLAEETSGFPGLEEARQKDAGAKDAAKQKTLSATRASLNLNYL
jgi:hypothetical protein